MSNEVSVHVKPHTFVTFSVAGQAVEVLLEEISADRCKLNIRTAKPVKGLRVLQELTGMQPTAAAIASVPMGQSVRESIHPQPKAKGA